MVKLTPKQLRLTLAFALLVYAAIMAAIVIWVMLSAEETVKARIAASPNVTVALAGNEPEVPTSWQAPVEEPAPEVMPKTEQLPEAVDEANKAEPAAIPEPKPEPVVAATSAPPVAPAAWHKFARLFDQKDQRPRIALIITDLGMAAAATQSAIKDMPGEVSLAFSSAAPDLEQLLGAARTAGHEAILTIPMEPENYPQNDSGPNSLLLGLPDQDNVKRLKRAMASTDGYVAIAPYMGEKFVTVEKKLVPVLEAVKEQDVLIFDSTLSRSSLIAPLSRYEKIPFARSDMLIDAASSTQPIDAQLQDLEQMAREKGQAVAVALPYPVTFEKLTAWIATLEKKGIALAPLTAVASEEVPAEAIAETPAAPVSAAAPTTAGTAGPMPATTESLPSQP